MANELEVFLAKHSQPAKWRVFEATSWFCDITRLIGPGFHPESEIADYIDGDGADLFTPSQAETLQAMLDIGWEKLNDAEIDPCEICLPIQLQMLEQVS